MENPANAHDVGSRTHCVHGSRAFDQEIIDWRPFDYYSYREDGPFGAFVWTFELAGEEPDTTVTARVRLAGGRRQRMLMPLARPRLRRLLERNLEALAAQVERSGARLDR